MEDNIGQDKQRLIETEIGEKGQGDNLQGRMAKGRKANGLSEFMISQHLRKSSFLDEQDQENSRNQTKQTFSETSRSSQLHSNHILGTTADKFDPKIALKLYPDVQPSKEQEIYVSQNEQYESISSEKSQSEQKQTNNLPQIQGQNIKYPSIICQLNSIQKELPKSEKYQTGNEQKKTVYDVRIQARIKNMESQKSKESKQNYLINRLSLQTKYEQTRPQSQQKRNLQHQSVQFNLKTTSNIKAQPNYPTSMKMSPNISSISDPAVRSRPQLSLNKYEKSKSNFTMSNYSKTSLKANSDLERKSDRQISPSETINYLSNFKSNSIVEEKSKTQMDFNASLEYLRSTKTNRFAESRKTISSQEQLRKQEKSDQVHFIEQKPQSKLDQSQVIMIDGKFNKKIKQRSNQKHSSHQPSLFYVSISTQDMYPSLDLNKKVKQLTPIRQEHHPNEQICQQTRVNSSIIKVKSCQKPQKKLKLKSSDPSLPQRIRIQSYRSQYFLKIQTQIFIIQVDFPEIQDKIQMSNLQKNKSPSNRQNSFKCEQQKQRNKDCYSIERRFSDFVFLYEAITTNHLGYIIHPFPQKSLQSFVKIKLQSLIGTTIYDGSSSITTTAESQKVQLIEKRISELEKFINFIVNHEELKFSQELAIFLCKDSEIYIKSKQRIQKYIQEYQELENSSSIMEDGKKNIKKAFESGFGKVMEWWGTPATEEIRQAGRKIEKSKIVKQSSSNNTIADEDIQFGRYFETLSIYYSKYNLLEKTLLRLIENQQKFVAFKDIDTQFDYLVKLCTKVSSGKEYHKNLMQVMEIQLISDIQTGRKWLQQTKSQLQKRADLKLIIQRLKDSLTYTNDSSSKISKLQRRLERFQKNFRFGFQDLLRQSQAIFESTKCKFIHEWQNYCLDMKKVWK